jgi:myxalamid-type polyketide synthase MxaB
LLTPVTDEELLAAGVEEQVWRRPAYVRSASPPLGAEMFDAEFFGYSSREATLLDPQQRLLLECAWEALEDAGYDPIRFPGGIGVYAGASWSTHSHRVLSDRTLLAKVGGFQAMVASDKDLVATET